jgi:hypothetical protein
VAVEPVVVEVPRQEHALEIFEGIAEHAEAYDAIIVLVYPGEVYCWQRIERKRRTPSEFSQTIAGIAA